MLSKRTAYHTLGGIKYDMNTLTAREYCEKYDIHCRDVDWEYESAKCRDIQRRTEEYFSAILDLEFGFVFPETEEDLFKNRVDETQMPGYKEE